MFTNLQAGPDSAGMQKSTHGSQSAAKILLLVLLQVMSSNCVAPGISYWGGCVVLYPTDCVAAV